MKEIQVLFRLALAGVLLVATGASATVFTNTTAISPLDTSYDGADIVISNCTVTMDGVHSFNSVLVGAGGALTHTFLSSGSRTLAFNVTNEMQILDGYFPATLLNSSFRLYFPHSTVSAESAL